MPSDANRVHFRVSEAGAIALAERGVVLPAVKSGKPVAYSCLDWTERRWHLGGALGQGIVTALLGVGCIERIPGSRVVMLNDSLDRWLES